MPSPGVFVVAAAALLLAAGCLNQHGGAAGHLQGVAVAGPTCPVVTDPPQSGCEDRPVAGAEIVIVSGAGDEVATVTTGDDGRFAVDLAAGRYEVRPQPVEGLMHKAQPLPMTVTVTIAQPVSVKISYDTGIR
jgi:hypothetical protein